MSSPANGQLETLRLVEQADVYRASVRVATRTASGVEFRYLDELIARGGPPVASTLPLRPDPLLSPAGALPSYFAGLLPEGRRLGALRRAVKTSADDELSLLLAVGADAIGDVQVVPAGVAPAEVPPRIMIDSMAEASFAELLVELGIRAQRMALPGVQDKTSAAMINLPVASAGERFILKLNPIDGYRFLAENEAFFLDAAAASGLTVPPHQLVTDRDGTAGLSCAASTASPSTVGSRRWRWRTAARPRTGRLRTSTCSRPAPSSPRSRLPATRRFSPAGICSGNSRSATSSERATRTPRTSPSCRI